MDGQTVGEILRRFAPLNDTVEAKAKTKAKTKAKAKAKAGFAGNVATAARLYLRRQAPLAG